MTIIAFFETPIGLYDDGFIGINSPILDMAELPNRLEEFRDIYLEDVRKVDIYTKSKKYSKIGLWISGVFWYFTIALYFQDESNSQEMALAFGGTALLSTILTVLLWVNARRSSFDETVLSSHDIAQLLNAYEVAGIDGLIEKYSDVKDRLKENEHLSPKRRKELSEFFEMLQDDSDQVRNGLIESNLEILVEDVDRSISKEVKCTKEDEAPIVNESPGFLEVIFTAVSSDNISSSYVFWILFASGAIVGTIIAFWKGQGWGVLVVTILFAALQFHDSGDS